MKIKSTSRRRFVIGTAAAGSGLALGFHLPAIGAAAKKSAAAMPGTEVNAWVVIRPDDTCVVRIARSEMGQGTLTGLAQLVVEELECDWNKIAYEMPSFGDLLIKAALADGVQVHTVSLPSADQDMDAMIEISALQGGRHLVFQDILTWPHVSEFLASAPLSKAALLDVFADAELAAPTLGPALNVDGMNGEGCIEP